MGKVVKDFFVVISRKEPAIKETTVTYQSLFDPNRSLTNEYRHEIVNLDFDQKFGF